MPPAPPESRPDPGLPAAAMPLPFEQMFEFAPMAVNLTRRSDGCLLAVNQAWERMTGLRREQVIGRTTLELKLWRHDADRQHYLEGLEQGDEPRCSIMINGQERHVRMHTAEIAGDEPLLLVYLQDIEHEVEAERERDLTQAALQAANYDLQQRVELHGAIEKLAQVGHWTNAPSADEVVFSPGLHEITGLSLNPTLQRSEGRGGIHPDDMPAWLAEYVSRRWPRYLLRRNLWGPPSVLILRRDLYADYDVRLKWLVDVDLYSRVLSQCAPRLIFMRGAGVVSAPAVTSITRTLQPHLASIHSAELALLAGANGTNTLWLQRSGLVPRLLRGLESVAWHVFRATWKAMHLLRVRQRSRHQPDHHAGAN